MEAGERVKFTFQIGCVMKELEKFGFRICGAIQLHVLENDSSRPSVVLPIIMLQIQRALSSI
jgi:hypothetical protein